MVTPTKKVETSLGSMEEEEQEEEQQLNLKDERKRRREPVIRYFTSVYFEPFIEEFVDYMSGYEIGEGKKTKHGKIFNSRFSIVEDKRGFVAEISGKRKWFKDSYALGEWLYINSERNENVIYPKYVPKKLKQYNEDEDEKYRLAWSDDYGK